MSTGIGKTLIDSEKVMIDGAEAYRLFFYDEQEGYVIKVISYVALNDLYLNKPKAAIPVPDVNPNVAQVENAIR